MRTEKRGDDPLRCFPFAVSHYLTLKLTPNPNPIPDSNPKP